MTHELLVLPWSSVPPEKPEDFTNKRYVDAADAELGVELAAKAGRETATPSADGLMSAADKTKLDGMSPQEVPIATTTTVGIVKPDGTTITVEPDGTIAAIASFSNSGAPITIPLLAAGSASVICPHDATCVMIMGFVRTGILKFNSPTGITLTCDGEAFTMQRTGSVDKYGVSSSTHFPVYHKFVRSFTAGQGVTIALGVIGTVGIDTVDLYAQFYA